MQTPLSTLIPGVVANKGLGGLLTASHGAEVTAGSPYLTVPFSSLTTAVGSVHMHTALL